ncbi:diaminopimelate epimerase [Parasphingorhabdus halotolerans]|uniref:Diaminopimelate epimerase n=1 Tax=Parasphingorhabdus halotolerans TaxID=2725558 RepID=A0A6H2DKQ7_9SPHN|nr:diaminopimelate epimerase [Parasphingorhabdus halotolerans]QJB68331.1 diaminopimelate epimerase [Parasphingorhabdus halotolerans]
MTLGQFHKMHGLGNDFVVIDAREYALEIYPVRAAAIANRKNGIGCDQLIVLRSSDKADVKMQIFNADGSEVESCGNATRCVAKLLGDTTSIETEGGMLLGRAIDGGAIVDMGKPRFEWEAIPLAYAMDSLHMPIGWEDLHDPVVVNVGNPHVIFFVDDINNVPLERLGPIIEVDPVFPEKVNVNIAHISGNSIYLRVWERGVGVTLACGTGACATAVAAIRRGLVKGPVDVHLPGGILNIAWEDGGSISMQGPTTYVFSGEADWNNFG